MAAQRFNEISHSRHIAKLTKAANLTVAACGSHGLVPEFLPLVDVGEVHLYCGQVYRL